MRGLGRPSVYLKGPRDSRPDPRGKADGKSGDHCQKTVRGIVGAGIVEINAIDRIRPARFIAGFLAGSAAWLGRCPQAVHRLRVMRG